MVRQNPALLQPLLRGSRPRTRRRAVHQREPAGVPRGAQRHQPAAAPAHRRRAPRLPPRPRPVRIQLTPESDAIGRLQQLGFEKDAVIQAYMACDKNETLAANLLFDGMGD